MRNHACWYDSFSIRVMNCSLPIKSLILVFCIVALGACGMAESKSEAESVVSNHFAAIAEKNYEKALDDYSPLFLEKTPRDEWLTSMKIIESKLGSFESFKTSGWKIQNRVDAAGKGTYVDIVCDTKYAKYTARETFVLYKGNESASMKIISHNINSSGLIKN